MLFLEYSTDFYNKSSDKFMISSKYELKFKFTRI